MQLGVIQTTPRMAFLTKRWSFLAVAACVFLSLPQNGVSQTTDDSPLTISGDLRIRGAWDIDRTGNSNRVRPRARFRVGLERQLSSTITVGGRLVTGQGPTDPNSPHQSFGTGFRNFNMALDRAYLRWQPAGNSNTTVYVGKFSHPFVSPAVYGELVWDGDVQPEGAAAVLTTEGGLRFSAAQYLVVLQSPGTSVGITAVQAAWSGSAGENLSASVAGSFYGYGQANAPAATLLAGENQGNAMIAGPAFASDFSIIHSFGSLKYTGGATPLVVSVQHIVNVQAATGFDKSGFAVGLEAGALNGVGTWRGRYQFQDIGQESIFSAFAQDDFLNGTGFSGHMVGFAYQVLPRGHINMWSLWSAPSGTTLQKRFRVDFNVSF